MPNQPHPTDADADYWKSRRAVVMAADDEAWDALDEAFRSDWQAAFARCLIAVATATGYIGTPQQLAETAKDEAGQAYRYWRGETAPDAAARVVWDELCMT